MDSEFPLPAKRPRGSYNGNLQLTECVREFKLPRQFPSMVTKVCLNNVVNDNNRTRQNFDAMVTCLPKTPIVKTIMTNQEISMPSVVRKIKLKGRDGRDLGEVNVQDLPQNIQGKTITLAKNGVKKPPEILFATDRAKGVTVGVLTPVNIVKKDVAFAGHLPSLLAVNKEQKETAAPAPRDTKKKMIIEQKQMSAVMDEQGRPQVLVFQSGKNWHMVKIGTSAPGQPPPNGNVAAANKLPASLNCGKATVMQVKDQSWNVRGEAGQNSAEKFLTIGATSGANTKNMVVKRWPLLGTPEADAADRSKLKFAVAAENAEPRPKIEISRVIVPSAVKPVSHIQPVTQVRAAAKLPGECVKASPKPGRSQAKKLNLRQDVMVVLPSDVPQTLNGDSELLASRNVVQPARKIQKNNGTVVSEKTIETAKIPIAAGSTSSTTEMTKPADAGDGRDEISGNLNILTKALSMVEDKELRAKALKALRDCGIGTERLVPINPPSEKRPVKDSGTQTAVFGIFEPENFIHVTPEISGVERIRAIERKTLSKIGRITGNPHSQDLSLNSPDLTNWVTEENVSDAGAMVEAYLATCDGISEVRDIFAKPHPVRHKLASQLEEDFLTCKKYDEDGLLNIHRAVINDNLLAVSRQLKVLRACGGSADLPTADGQTSLELAVRYEVSKKIVEELLDYGADPTSPETGHDSALLIASKKSLPILADLMPYVSDPKNLDHYDTSGFSALHHCAQNDNRSGVIELARGSADVNLRDRRSGRTALFHAIENDNIELAKLLLDRGARPDIASYSGHTVFALLEDGKHYSLMESLNRAVRDLD